MNILELILEIKKQADIKGITERLIKLYNSGMSIALNNYNELKSSEIKELMTYLMNITKGKSDPKNISDIINIYGSFPILDNIKYNYSEKKALAAAVFILKNTDFLNFKDFMKIMYKAERSALINHSVFITGSSIRQYSDGIYLKNVYEDFIKNSFSEIILKDEFISLENKNSEKDLSLSEFECEIYSDSIKNFNQKYFPESIKTEDFITVEELLYKDLKYRIDSLKEYSSIDSFMRKYE